MGVDAAAALATGWWYDRAGRRILPRCRCCPRSYSLAFTTSPALAVAGVLAWGAILGIQESTMRAAVADLVPAARRGTAYGIFAARLRRRHPPRRTPHRRPLRPLHHRADHHHRGHIQAAALTLFLTHRTSHHLSGG